MSVTVVSRPSNFASVYVPVEYEFSSTFAGVTGAVSYFQDDGNGKLEIVYSGIFQPRVNLHVGGIVTITNNDDYNGEYLVIQKDSSARLTLDTPYISDSFGGNMSFSMANINMVCDLYVGGSFVVRKFRFPNVSDNFVFDFSKELQIELGNNMSPLEMGSDTVLPSTESYGLVYVKYAEVHDELIDGIATPTFTLDEAQSPPDLFDDSANSITVINSTVPYIEWTLGSIKNEIINKDVGLSAFTPNSLSKRFLTNSPKTILIGRDESYQLNAIVDFDVAIGYKVKIATYDSTGTLDTTYTTTFVPGTDAVWAIPAGGRDFATGVIDSNIFSYEISIIDSLDSNAEISETITFNIDTVCHGSSTRFVWLNPRGGYDAFTFTSPRKLNSSVSKTTFNPSRSYPVVVGAREEATTNVFASDSITTSTNKVTAEVAEWLQELLESPQVFIELSSDNALHNKRVPVTLINKTRSIANNFDGLFNVSIRYKFAFDKIGLRAY